MAGSAGFSQAGGISTCKYIASIQQSWTVHLSIINTPLSLSRPRAEFREADHPGKGGLHNTLYEWLNRARFNVCSKQHYKMPLHQELQALLVNSVNLWVKYCIYSKACQEKGETASILLPFTSYLLGRYVQLFPYKFTKTLSL